jgi:signal transduction histidine kinase
MNWYQIGHIRKRGLWAMATIFYRQNQNYILMLLSGLLVGLVLVNYYRRRTKSNLDLIARQKDELERTHEALKEAQEIIIQQERYKQAKDIAGGFAHEIRNSLLPVETAIALLGRIDPSAPEAPAKLEKHSRNIGSAVSRAVELTHLISEYSHLEAQKQPEQVDLRQILEKVIESNRIRVERQAVSIDIDIPAGTMVASSRSHLEIVFNNLLLNALDALTDRPEPRIIVTSGNEPGMVTLRFSDNGCGIAEKDLPRVFDTFFSTKPSSGRGWGLTMARRIMQLYDGEIAVESKESEGTTFTLMFRQPG